MVEFSKYFISWKIILEPVAGNVVEAIVGGLTYVVVSKAPYEELVDTTECITLYTRCRTNPGRYN